MRCSELLNKEGTRMTEMEQTAFFVDANGSGIDTASAIVSESWPDAFIAQLRLSTPPGFQFLSFFIDEGTDFYFTRKTYWSFVPSTVWILKNQMAGWQSWLLHSLTRRIHDKRYIWLTISIVKDVDETPTSMQLSQNATQLPKVIQSARKIANIMFDDDALGQTMPQTVTTPSSRSGIRLNPGSRMVLCWILKLPDSTK